MKFLEKNQALYRQDPNVGIESFIKKGVRPSFIPTLINYFHGREMYVKWYGTESNRRKANSGGPQRGTIGIIRFFFCLRALLMQTV